MDTTKKHYIEFCDNIFAIEDVLRVEKYASWRWKDDDKKEKVFQSYIYFNVPDRGFYFPGEEYKQIKKIIFDYNNSKETEIREN